MPLVRRFRILPSCLPIAVAAVALGWSASAWAVINPNYTPTDLVRSSSQIVSLKVAIGADKALSAEVVDTIKGDPLKEKKLSISYGAAQDIGDEEVKAAVGPDKEAFALLLLSAGDKGGKKAAAEAEATDDEPAGALLIGTYWHAVYRTDGALRIDKDKQEIFMVWAGSARMLAEAARYVQSTPAASFPVKSDIKWDSDLSLGKLSGKAHGCMLADFGGDVGLCAIVLCDGGDRVYRAGTAGAPPADVTAKVKLATKSKRAVVGDFNGDGRLDFASWDGETLKVAVQSADGTFAAPVGETKLADCLSLDVIDVGAKSGAGVVVGTAKGPRLLTPDGKKVDIFDYDGSLGEGGVCAVGDFTGDGKTSILQLFSKGTVLFAADGAGKFKPPVAASIPLVKNPRVAIAGDYDADGKLDVLCGGDDGIALLSHSESTKLQNNLRVTGELDYHGNQNRPLVIAAGPADINNDGRQGMVLSYHKGNPMVFFNRGFACFGLARELSLSSDLAAADPGAAPAEQPAERLKGTIALEDGQQGGLVWDLNGDGAEDMLSISPEGEVWVLFGKAQDRAPLGLTISLSPKSPGPVTVSVSDAKRRVGMHVVRPGVPAYVGRLTRGPLNLQWAGTDGQPRTKTVTVLKPTRVEIEP